MHRNNNAPQKLFQLNVQHNGRTRSLLELVKSRLIDQNLTLDHYFSLMIIMGKCLQAWPDVLICHLSKGRIISKGQFGVLEFFEKKNKNEFVVVVKTNLFVCFLVEFEDAKSPFEII